MFHTKHLKLKKMFFMKTLLYIYIKLLNFIIIIIFYIKTKINHRLKCLFKGANKIYYFFLLINE